MSMEWKLIYNPNSDLFVGRKEGDEYFWCELNHESISLFSESALSVVFEFLEQNTGDVSSYTKVYGDLLEFIWDQCKGCVVVPLLPQFTDSVKLEGNHG